MKFPLPEGKYSLLIIDDDKILCDSIRYEFQSPAYKFTVFTAQNREEGLQACKRFKMMQNALYEAKFPSLNRYVIMDMEGGKCGIVLPLGEYQWGLLVDTQQCQLGLILNVAIPKALSAFEEARAEV